MKEYPALSLFGGFLFGLFATKPPNVADLLSQLKHIFRKLLRQISPAGRRFPDLVGRFERLHIDSGHLGRSVKVEVYLPPWYDQPAARNHYYPTVLFNDGQDLAAVQLPRTMAELYRKGRIQGFIAVGIFPEKYRMQEYGTADRPDYKGRGGKAGSYRNFILLELLPLLRKDFRIRIPAQNMAFAGFSLGGLSAFDLAWHFPAHFGCVAVFSGALWWRSAAFREEDPDADRIVHSYLTDSPLRIGQRYWFQTGTQDETSDRNRNGIIDSIDDTLDLIRALKANNTPEEAIRYVELAGGRHEPATWAKALPDFLLWWLNALEDN